MDTRALTREQVYAQIDRERDYQDVKWGSDKRQSLAGYLIILQKELNEAVDGWMKDSPGRNAPLNEITQVAAVAVACLEQYGCDGTTGSGLDFSDPAR